MQKGFPQNASIAASFDLKGIPCNYITAGDFWCDALTTKLNISSFYSEVPTSMQNTSGPFFNLGFGTEHDMSESSSDDSEEDNNAVSSMARSTPSIQRLSVIDCEVFEHEPEDSDLENSEGLVPYSQTSQEDDTDDTTTHKTSTVIPPRFKPPSSDINVQKLSSKTFAAATEKKILWATKLYMEWREVRLAVDGDKGDIFRANLNAVNIDPDSLC